MCQDTLSSFGDRDLVVERELAKSANLDGVINDFAMKKSRKGKIWINLLFYWYF